jgi:hypothetical protein
MTPGCEASISCLKSIWRIRMYHDETEDFRRKLLTAQECKEFTLVPMLWMDGTVEFEKGDPDGNKGA